MRTIVTSYFGQDNVPILGLTPKVKIREIATKTVVIDWTDMYELGDGFYGYDFETYDADKTYVILCDAGPSISNRYSRGTNQYDIGKDFYIDF